MIGDQILPDIIGAKRMKFYSILVEPQENIDQMIDEGIQIAKERQYIQEGDIVVIAGGASILTGHQTTKLNKTIGGVLKV